MRPPMCFQTRAQASKRGTQLDPPRADWILPAGILVTGDWAPRRLLRRYLPGMWEWPEGQGAPT